MQGSESYVYVGHFAFQVPMWLGVLVLAAVLVGAWKLAKIIWAALSH
jgi:hypothetical protein